MHKFSGLDSLHRQKSFQLLHFAFRDNLKKLEWMMKVSIVCLVRSGAFSGLFSDMRNRMAGDGFGTPEQ